MRGVRGEGVRRMMSAGPSTCLSALDSLQRDGERHCAATSIAGGTNSVSSHGAKPVMLDERQGANTGSRAAQLVTG